MFALDSWAVLRLLDGTEPAASRVSAVLDGDRPVMSWVNLGEVYYIVRRLHSDQVAQQVVFDVRTAISTDLPTEHGVLDAARLKADYSMAYADAFAAATAIRHGATLLTGDPELLVEGAPWAFEDLRGP